MAWTTMGREGIQKPEQADATESDRGLCQSCGQDTQSEVLRTPVVTLLGESAKRVDAARRGRDFLPTIKGTVRPHRGLTFPGKPPIEDHEWVGAPVTAFGEMRMNTAVHFSSASDIWATPSDVYSAFNDEFRFDFEFRTL